MSKINVKSIDMWLYKADAVPVTMVPLTISKSNPAVVSVGDVSTLTAGQVVGFSGTDFTELDGDVCVIGSVDTGANTFTLAGVDTSNSTATLGTSPEVHVYQDADRVKLCLSSIDIAAPTVNQVDTSTYCEVSSIPGRATPGQITFTGFVEDDSVALDEIIAADDDGGERIFLITTRTDQGYFLGGVTLAGIGYTFPLEGAVGFTISGSQTQKIVYYH